MVPDCQDQPADNKPAGQDGRRSSKGSPKAAHVRCSSVFSTVSDSPSTATASETTSLLRDAPAKWVLGVPPIETSTNYYREARLLAKNAGPLWVTFSLQYSLTLCSIFAVGNLGKTELAAASLGSMTAVITGYCPYQGLSTALDTLCAQAYGAGNKKLVGLQFQRMLYFLLLLTIPIATFWVVSDRVLGAILPEPELAAYAGLYLKISALGAPGYAIFEAGKKFVQAQGLFTATTYVLLVCAPLNAVLNYILVWHPKIGMGFVGAPAAVVIINWLMPVLLFLYVRFIHGYECWNGFSTQGFRDWWPMIKLAFPGLVSMESEFLAFEILTLVCAWLGTEYVATQSVLAITATTAFQLPFAISIASCTRVANFVGATASDAARIAAKTGLVFACCSGLFNFALLMLIRHQFIRWFTSDDDVIVLFEQTIPLGAAFQLADSIGCMASAILRSQGRQHLASYVNLIAYYPVALPISMMLCFIFKWKLIGLWLGESLALLLVAGVESYIVLSTDWGRVVEAAKERVVWASVEA